MQFIALEKLHNISEGYRQRFRIAQLDVILLRFNGCDYIYSAVCPHAQGMLWVGRDAAAVVRCAKHGFEFDIESGRLLRPEGVACAALTRYQAVYEAQSIGLLMD